MEESCTDILKVNHAATEDDCLRTSPKCADEGSDKDDCLRTSMEIGVGQTWAYYSDDSYMGVVLEFYTIVCRSPVRELWSREESGNRPFVAWDVVITSALSGAITLRKQRFPAEHWKKGYRRLL